MIVNTRPRLLSDKLIELSNNLNLEILNAHLSEIVSLDLEQDFQSSAGYLNKISAYKNIIFTSQASAEIGLRILQKNISIDLDILKIFSIGPATKQILLKKGIDSISPNESSSRALLELIQEKYPGRNLLFCGENSNKFLQKNLNNLDEIICYKLKFNAQNIKKITKNHKVILIYNFLTFDFIYKSVDPLFLDKKILVTASKRIKNKIEMLVKNKDLQVFAAKEPTDKSMLDLAKSFI